MNKVCKSVWNESIGAWVAVSESAAARGKKSSGSARTPLGLTAIALAGASLGLPSAATLAAENRAALFNDFTDGTCTAIYDGDTTHGAGIYSGAACSPSLGNAGSATSIGLNGGGSGTNGTNLISNQSGAFINGGLEVFGSNVAAGSPAAYIHGGLSLFSNGTTSGTANKLIGVAAGTDANDAVNVSQLTAGLAGVKNKYLSANDAASSADGATAIGIGSIAVGGNAVADSTGDLNAALAIGSDSRASMKATAIGSGATASALDTVALGTLSVADRQGTVSVGNATTKRQIVNVAAGTQAYDAVNVTQLQNVTTLLGGGATVNTDGTVTAPAYTVAGATAHTVGDAVTKIDTALTSKVAYDSVDHSQVTLGGTAATAQVKLTNVKAADLTATSKDAVNGSQLFGTNQRVGLLETFETNINNGGGIKYFHSNSTLVDSSATGADSVAIGGAAVASAKNAVALGSNSVADRDNSVSVGAAGKERQIINVAAGTATTDAVNLGQLAAVSNNLETLSNFAVKYDTNTDGTPNHEQITLGGAGAKKPTLLTNLASGKLAADSTDAVNGSQLYATNQNVASLQAFTDNVNNGGGIKYFHSNSTLVDSSATGVNSVAIGGAALSSGTNSVALGASSIADRDNTVSVGAAGSERQVTNVAAGTATTDAVNLGQLNAVSNTVTTLSASAIKYDTHADGTPDYANATLGNGNATGTALHNVAAGTSSMDAVNLGQMSDMMDQVTNLANGAYNPLFSADGNRDTEVATSSGSYSVASGANAVASGVNSVASGATSVASGANAIAVGSNTSATANNAVAVGANALASGVNAVASGASSVASGANAVAVGASTSATGTNALASGASSVASANNAVAVGANASASAESGVAVGANASATANNAVAIGSGSVADRDNSVSVGSQGNERQITNVARGTNPTDAVNVAQLQGVQQNVNNLARAAYSGIAMAGALAGLPQVEAGKSFQLSAGAGAYANYAALAVGASARLTQNTIVKLGASATNGSHVLVNAGVGYSW
jgi:autotransporter adhesin